MLIDAVRGLYAFNGWANERILEMAARLTPEQWLAPGTAGRGSVRDTLVHMIAAQRRWLAWWDGSLSPEQAQRLAIEPADYPDVASVQAGWASVDRATQTFLDGLSEAQLERVYEATMPNGRTYRLRLWQMMLHVANHATQHRSEVAAMLTSYDQSPGDLDLAKFFPPVGELVG